MKIDDKVKKMD